MAKMYTFLSIFLIFLKITFLFGKEISLSGAGASFPSIVYRDWNTLYSSYRAQFVNISAVYQRLSSGVGLSMIENKSVAEPIVYAASDADMKPEEHLQFPELKMFPSLAG